MTIIADTAARKLLHGGGGAGVARGVAAFSFGLDGLWHLIAGFFADIFGYLLRALAGVARLLVLPFEALRHLLVAAAGAISSGINSLWQLVSGFFPQILAALAGAAHDIGLKLEAFWRWLHAAAAAALPYVLGAAAVLLVVAFIWYLGRVICVVTVAACKALVIAVSYLAYGLSHVRAAGAGVLSWLLPPCARCLRCCAVVAMKAPGAAGMVISRAAFEAAPALYFQILRAGGAVVAAAVFCAPPVASALARPVAFLFRTSVALS